MQCQFMTPKQADRARWSRDQERNGRLHPRDERRVRLDMANLLRACRDAHGAADLACLEDAGYFGPIITELGPQLAVEHGLERCFAAPSRFAARSPAHGAAPFRALRQEARA